LPDDLLAGFFKKLNKSISLIMASFLLFEEFKGR